MKKLLVVILLLTGCKASHSGKGDTPAAQSLNLLITSPADGSVTGPMVALSFTATLSASYECTVDSVPVVCDPVNGVAAGNFPDGVHVFKVTATGVSGGVVTDMSTWYVDAVGPAVAITAPTPATTTRSGVVQFGSSDAAIVNFICKLDGVSVSCYSGNTYSNLSAGPHTFEVRGIDAYGNFGPPDSVTWTAL